MVSYGDRPNDYDSVSKCILFVVFSDVLPGLTAFQTSGISLASSTNLAREIESGSCTVSGKS